MTTALFIAVLTLIFIFVLTNGFLDGGSIVSTVVITRVMEPFPALCLVAACQVVGIFLFGSAVVRVLGFSMMAFPASASAATMLGTLLAAMLGTLIWNLMMWRLSLPSSSSHALLGGLVGAVWQSFGLEAVSLPVLVKVLIALAVVPLVSMVAGYLLCRLLYWSGQYATPAAAGLLRVLHVVALTGISLVHGSNDGQKSLALVVLALLASGQAVTHATLPVWIALLCGMTLGLGVVFGSRPTVRTVGRGFYKMQELQGLCAESVSMVLVGVSSLIGFPMSTTHVMSGSVIGAGAAVRPRGIRWDLAGGIGLAWVLTIPMAGALSASISYVVSKAF